MDNKDMNDYLTISQNLGIIRDHAKEVQEQIDALTEKLQFARGTSDVTTKAEAAQVALPRTRTRPQAGRPSNKDRLYEALKGVTFTPDKLAKATGISLNRVEDALTVLKGDKKVHNIGSESFPRFTARIGDDTNTKDLTAEIRRLVAEQPMTMPELEEVTGAKQSRISGALVYLQRTEGSKVLNLGTQRRAKWFILDQNAKSAALQPRTPAPEDEKLDF